MGKYSGYLICTDLDGTFIDEKGELIEKNLTATYEYMKNGGLFTISTGRSAGYIKEKYKGKIKINTYIICINGTMIYDAENEKVIYSNVMKREKLSGISEYIKKVPKVAIYTEDKVYEEIESISGSDDIYKIVYCCRTEKECLELREELEEKYGQDFDFNRSWHEGLEMIGKGSGKGDAIRKMRSLLGDKAKTVIGIGDFENDLTMIEEADIGVAVGNALESVKEVADKVTVSNNDGAIAQIIKEL